MPIPPVRTACFADILSQSFRDTTKVLYKYIYKYIHIFIHIFRVYMMISS